MQNSRYKLFEHTCVLKVCVHIHPIMIKIHPVFFFKSPFSNQAVLRVLSEWCSSAQAPPTIVDWQDCLTLDPPRVNWELLCRLRCRARQNRLRLSDLSVLLLDVIMNITVVIYSRHLSCWRRRGLRLLSFWRECGDLDLPKCIYVRTNNSWSSLIYRRSEYKSFYESLQITFSNNVLVSQFHVQSAPHSTDKRGGVSRAH